MHIVFLPDELRELSRTILSGSHHAVCGMGRNARAREWMCHEVAPDSPRHGHMLTVRGVHDPAAPLPPGDSAAESLPGHAGTLTLGVGAAAGRFWGQVRNGESQWSPVEGIRLLGPGLPILGKPQKLAPVMPEDLERWSRTIGALGEATWRRQMAMHHVVVGAGRTGSIVAAELAQVGVRRLTLIDPDRVETSSLGEMALEKEDVGSAKVDALARVLAAHGRATQVEPLMVGVTERPALQALQEADVIFSCVDDNAARLVVTGMATAYLKPLVDIGAAVLMDGEVRQAGVDVRVTLGDCCLSCLGGVSGEDEARERLRRAWPGRLVRNWRSHRAGSLRALNQVAVGTALQLWFGVLAGTAGSAWVQMELAADGQIVAHHAAPDATTSEGCRMCSRRGLGDDALRWV